MDRIFQMGKFKKMFGSCQTNNMVVLKHRKICLHREPWCTTHFQKTGYKVFKISTSFCLDILICDRKKFQNIRVFCRTEVAFGDFLWEFLRHILSFTTSILFFQNLLYTMDIWLHHIPQKDIIATVILSNVNLLLLKLNNWR